MFLCGSKLAAGLGHLAVTGDTWNRKTTERAGAPSGEKLRAGEGTGDCLNAVLKEGGEGSEDAWAKDERQEEH